MSKGKPKPRKSIRRAGKARGAARDIPNKASIIATDTLIAPDGRRYTILETNQTDPYDSPNPPRPRRSR